MKTTKQVQKELQDKFPFLELIGEYTGANNKVLIRCNDCGFEWEAVPRSVIASKCGCKKCKVNEQRFNKAKESFLAKLDTSKYEFIEYKNYMDVTVKCKTCGYLRTTNADNIHRFGCPKCGQVRTHNAQKLTLNDILRQFKGVHGDKYDYSKVDYINYTTPIIIICPEHGEFAQSPAKHIAGQGCPKCAGRNKTTDDFINEAKLIHKDKYDYSKCIYINKNTPVSIICKKHGEFKQLPYVHVALKCGCPKCNMSHGEELVNNILTELNIEFKTQYRINNPYSKEGEVGTFIVDFYLPKLNAFIEYNGKQHYIPVDKFGGELQFQKQEIRDQHLRKYCTENSINLLEIKYSDTNISEIINNFLENCRVSE